MEWLARPFLSIGGAQITLVKVAQLLAAILVVVVIATTPSGARAVKRHCHLRAS